MTVTADRLASRLEAIVGPSNLHISADASYFAAGIAPQLVAKPQAPEQIAEIVRFAAAEKTSIVPSGARTKLNLGMPPSRYDIALDVSHLNQLAFFDPGDLTVGADAGMPLAQLQSILAAEHQMLPLDVPFLDRATVGGAIAAGLDSPLRQSYGTARDFLIGAEFVNGAGDLTKSGGRVVKNVTGYDLHKLLIGSLGTLAVITRLNFKTFPLPEDEGGFIASFSTLADALTLRDAIAKSPLRLSSFEILNAALAVQLFHSQPAASWLAIVTFEGHSGLLDRISRELLNLARSSNAAATELLDATPARQLRTGIREAIPTLQSAIPFLTAMRLSLPPAYDASLESLAATAAKLDLPWAILARASGSVYFFAAPTSDDDRSTHALAALANDSFLLAAKQNGQGFLLSCPPQLKSRINAWGPARSDFMLAQRIKQAFDPNNVFAPGRFAGGL